MLSAAVSCSRPRRNRQSQWRSFGSMVGARISTLRATWELVGHSAGWASVGRYQADSEDKRVAGLVFASPGVGYSPQADDPQLLAQAKKLVDDGAGEDLSGCRVALSHPSSAPQHT